MTWTDRIALFSPLDLAGLTLTDPWVDSYRLDDRPFISKKAIRLESYGAIPARVDDANGDA